MSSSRDRSGPGADQLTDLGPRVEALRQAASLPGAELRLLLESALIELDAAVSALLDAGEPGPSATREADALHAERRLLHEAFQQAPIAMFLLGPDGSIRRSNLAGAALLGAKPGYPTGKRFTALVDPPSRAAVQSQLAAAVRTGESHRFGCGLLGAHGVLSCEVTASTMRVRGGEDRLLLAVRPRPGTAGLETQAPGRQAAVSEVDSGDLLRCMTRRLDLTMAVSSMLLQNLASTEAVLIQRSARLLADHLATWVIVDLKDSDRLRRHTVAGPDQDETASRLQAVSCVDPPPDSAPAHVTWTCSSLLLAHAEDDGILGAAENGVPLLLLLDGASVLCVPIAASGICYGALTLVRDADHGLFGLADAGLAEESAEQLARAISVQRMISRRTATTEALKSSLLPGQLRPIPGVEVAAAHVPPTLGNEVGGDFYDIYPTPEGSGLSIGDVSGKSQGAAAVASAARNAIRVVGHWEASPSALLRAANDIMLAEAFEGRFVTADAVHVSWQGDRLRVILASAGHPGPVLITADGRARLIEGGGVPLGVFAEGEATIVRRELELGPGDVLFFCTDGLTGARSPDLRYFGDYLADYLAELAGRPPAQLIAGVERKLADFCDGILLDDVTMLAMRVTEPPASG